MTSADKHGEDSVPTDFARASQPGGKGRSLEQFKLVHPGGGQQS